jgi:calcium-translocating P-type ATPase
MATLAGAIVGVIIVNGLFSFWQQFRTERVLAALAQLLPHQARAVRGGEAVLLPVADLVPGDVILLEGGDDIPADCRVLEAFGLRVNTATVTGESLARTRHAAPAPENDDPLHARNLLLAGTSVIAGDARALVFATGMATQFGRIAQLTQATAEEPSPLQIEIARLSRVIAAVATALGTAFFLVGHALGLSFWENFVFAIGIIVAMVPEGLLPTLTLSLAFAAQRMARRKALVRHLPAVETLGAASVICTDKTGTLTENRMSVARVFADDAYVDPRGPAAPGSALERLLDTARHCHSLKLLTINGVTEATGDAMEIALVDAANSAVHRPRLPQVDEIPFDADRRRMSTLHAAAEGRVLYCKGAPEAVLPLCTAAVTAGDVVPLDDARRAAFVTEQQRMAAEGLRVLAFAHRTLAADTPREHWESGLAVSGLVGLRDPPRPEVPEAIRCCHDAGIRVVMVTGDHPATALAIAREIGLAGAAPRAITGEALRHLTDTQLQLVLDAPDLLFARVAPEQKLRVVSAFRRKGHIVAVTGDGVNDAPALKAADIGVAMGMRGTDVAREAADVVLLDDNFASIVAAIEEGRAVFDNVRKFMTYILTSNVPEIVPYLAFVLARIPLPLTIIQILAVDLGTDMLPALALGAEKPDPAVMQRRPRRRDERLLDWELLARAFLFLGPIQAVAALGAFFLVLHGAGWTYGTPLAANDPLYLQATTACLAAIVVMQIVNVFECRHPVKPVWSPELGANRLIAAGIAFEIALILAIVYTPWGQLAFGTAPLPAVLWLALVPGALALIALEELRKAIAYRARRRAGRR